VAASSYSGASALQWPHQGAKNSARTISWLLTKSVKVSFLRSWTSDADARAAAPTSPRAAFLKFLMVIRNRKRQ